MKEIYRGKAKSVYEAGEDEVVIEFRDDLTAGDGAKKATKAGKGTLNAQISAKIFEVLKEGGIKTHLKEFQEPNRFLAQKVRILLIEVICRNIAAGSFVRRYPVEKGKELKHPVIEFGYKSDEYHDPMLNEDIAEVLGLAAREELDEMRKITLRINEILVPFFRERGLTLVDFKVEFGRNSRGELLLADEISPDSCRLWDAKTGEVMDKDRFRQDMGGVIAHYEEVRKRVLE